LSRSTLAVALRLRVTTIAATGAGIIAVIVMLGALYPAVGDAIGTLDVPRGVKELLGGADYGTLAGWMRSEIGSVYGPLVVGAIGIAASVGTLAGEEESGELALTLAHPVSRRALLLGKSAAVVLQVLALAAATLAGLAAGVAVGGGGLSLAHMTALCVHLAAFGMCIAMLALMLAAATGRRTVASGGAAAVGLVSYLVNGFAPLVSGLHWLTYLSPFSYYARRDPIGRGVDVGDVAVLVGAALVLVVVAIVVFDRRDLRR
jgi:ABC-2 type transport system permease protein